MVRLIADAFTRVRHLGPEIAKFGVIGATGAVVDLGGTALLYGKFHLGPLTAKGVAVICACVVTYLGNRFWTFRHRENQPLLRETTLFFVLNAVGLLIAEVVIASTAYAFGAKDQIAYNLASVIGTGLGTIFRFWAYRKWVFLAPIVPDEPAIPVQHAPTWATGHSFQAAPRPVNGTANGVVHGTAGSTPNGSSPNGIPHNGSNLNGSSLNGSTARTPTNGASPGDAGHAPGRHRKPR